jgi:plastocyanin
MKNSHRVRTVLLVLVLVLLTGVLAAAAPAPDVADKHIQHIQVIVPEADRFSPFALTILAGEAVRWVNKDTDDHTIVSLDVSNTTGPKRINIVLPGTDSNGGKPGQFQLIFDKPGTWIYYCRFHSHLGDDHQPIAPGPKGGIQDADGNFGVPMMGVVTVLPNS